MYSSQQLDEIAKTIKEGQEFYITQNRLFRVKTLSGENRKSKIIIDRIEKRQPPGVPAVLTPKNAWMKDVYFWYVEIYIEHTETQEEEDFRIMTLEKFATLLNL